MKVGKTLLYLRTDRQLSQSFMAKNLMHTTAYSKIEQDKQNISFDTLIKLTTKLGVTIDEFISLVQNDTENGLPLMNETKILLMNIDENVNRLLEIYFICLKEKDDLFEYFSVYVLLKTLLSTKIEQIKPISEVEKKEIHVQLKKHFYSSKFISFYDYRILANILPSYQIEEINSLLTHVLPVEFIHSRNSETYKMIRLLYNNVISICIMNHEIPHVKYYLDSAFAFEKETPNLFFKTTLLHFKNVYLYLNEPKNTTKQEEYKQEAIYFMEVFKKNGYSNYYSQMKAEFEKVIEKPFNLTGDDFIVQILSDV